MQTEVFRRLEESSGTPVYWSLADVKSAINEGLEEMADETEYDETDENLSITANTTYYDLSDTTTPVINSVILTLKSAFNNQTNHWLETSHVREYDARFREWENATGEPTSMILLGLWWLRFDRYKTTTSGTVRLFYTKMPTALSANGDTPGFPQEFHYGLIAYALYDLLQQDGEMNKSLKFWGEFVQYRDALKRFVQGRASLDRIGGFRASRP